MILGPDGRAVGINTLIVTEWMLKQQKALAEEAAGEHRVRQLREAAKQYEWSATVGATIHVRKPKRFVGGA